MLLAQLHRKFTRREEDSEDLLTSNVFGALKYSGRVDILCRFLSGAVSHRAQGRLVLGEVTGCTFRFWPWLRADDGIGSAPDVLLDLEHTGGARSLVAVEAKYRSGKSSGPTAGGPGNPVNDQLAREWLCVRHAATEAGYERAHLVYLTADVGMPRDQLDEAADELQRKAKPPAEISWLSWRRLLPLLKDAPEPILVDLANLLRRAMLIFFEDVEWASAPPALRYVFEPADAELPPPCEPGAFAWPRPASARAYLFDGSAAFHWPLPHLSKVLAWRFV